jgi:hypothetical protein
MCFKAYSAMAMPLTLLMTGSTKNNGRRAENSVTLTPRGRWSVLITLPTVVRTVSYALGHLS